MSRSPEPQGIDYFNRGHWLSSIQERVSLRVRRQMFLKWRSLAKGAPVRRVLDVGTTPDLDRSDSNCMVPWLKAMGCELHLSSPEDIRSVASALGANGVVPVEPGGRIAARDGEFDWAIASAVIEHVGSEENQVDFVRECGRVSNGLFLTTPNRFHWLEFHTKLPFLHWLPKRIHRRVLACLGLSRWSEESMLNLLGAADLERVAARAIGSEFEFSIHRQWSLGMPSNLILLARRRSA